VAKLHHGTSWQRAYKIGIVENNIRNAIVVREAIKAASMGLPVMLLIQQTKHGKSLETAIKAMGVKTRFIWGKHEQEQRKEAVRQLREGEIQVLIGSTFLDVGVDVPSVGMVILAGGGKAEVALRQRIGRGLRAKRIGANVVFIVDFEDKHNSHLRGHYFQRRLIVEKTPGFGENILEAVKEFDYATLKAA